LSVIQEKNLFLACANPIIVIGSRRTGSYTRGTKSNQTIRTCSASERTITGGTIIIQSTASFKEVSFSEIITESLQEQRPPLLKVPEGQVFMHVDPRAS